MAQASASLLDYVSRSVGRDGAQKWWELSELAHRAALGADPTSVVQRLHGAADADPASPLAPAFRLWAADALGRVSRDREAVAAYDRVIAADSAPPFERIDFAREALRHRAALLARLGDIDAALASHRELAGRGEREALYHAGVMAERAGRFDGATQLYREIAAQGRGPDAGDPSQRALRDAERLTSAEGVFGASELEIARRVEDAVMARDGARLRPLASPTHFQAGPGSGHFRYEGDDVLERLCAELETSRPVRLHGGLLGSGDKRYLLTAGWRGSWFQYVVGFYFARSGRGWQWEGVVVNAPAEPWIERWAPSDKRTNQALTLPLLAPWPEGEHFMAGGLSVFIAQSAIITALAFIPFVGGALAAAQAFAFSLSNCGFGLRGFYYNAGPTHSGNDAFAIDFSRYRRGVPFWNVSGGTPVLAPADGIVRWSRGFVPSGSTSQANEVQIDHPVSGVMQYATRYLHFAGPGKVCVSTAMAAPTGRRLGLMNDTGTSVIDHLHFSIHQWAPSPALGPSVRPTPMDGHVLGDGDSGKCVRSTNREAIILPPGCGAVVVELFRRLLGQR
jgi:hypothetical protein